MQGPQGATSPSRPFAPLTYKLRSFQVFVAPRTISRRCIKFAFLMKQILFYPNASLKNGHTVTPFKMVHIPSNQLVGQTSYHSPPPPTGSCKFPQHKTNDVPHQPGSLKPTILLPPGIKMRTAAQSPFPNNAPSLTHAVPPFLEVSQQTQQDAQMKDFLIYYSNHLHKSDNYTLTPCFTNQTSNLPARGLDVAHLGFLMMKNPDTTPFHPRFVPHVKLVD